MRKKWNLVEDDKNQSLVIFWQATVIREYFIDVESCSDEDEDERSAWSYLY
jgi:hypothetical protein